MQEASLERQASNQEQHATIAVITVSDRSARGEREDISGPAALEALARHGYTTVTLTVVADGATVVRDAIAHAADAGARIILTLGGTGLSPRDETPEATWPLITRELPGIAEALRATARDRVPTAVLSRGLAGIIDRPGRGAPSLVVNLAGSPGAARDGVSVLAPLIPHVLDQLHGGDHAS
ncbi:molybdenum cofactor biosynthesis protein [Pseudoclavibacter sp. AY1F1]|uniref:MogA/MoaB family molybdenum cofactor biosynthesis protein n=1 Tax=Pseudoclavibacter sp. AY1F1 TaxID=2080583 RepID=UPI000CE812EC|nr:MogA/MoaB family molybdenum cofactor biosynthesis protein [Pseudoclavibacter sp. AY1F1]PPF44917.1 molybdenum cofactor biosynthesis protein [Pseudoclavibacter sp. AY1F1]